MGYIIYTDIYTFIFSESHLYFQHCGCCTDVEVAVDLVRVCRCCTIVGVTNVVLDGGGRKRAADFGRRERERL